MKHSALYQGCVSIVVPPEIAKSLLKDPAQTIGYSIQESYLGRLEMNDPFITLQANDGAGALYGEYDTSGIS